MPSEKHYTFWGKCAYCGQIQPMRPIKEIKNFTPDEFVLIRHRLYWEGPICVNSEGQQPEYCAEIRQPHENPYQMD